MSLHKGYEMWFGREIELDGVYYLFYPDQKSEYTKKQREEYDYLLSLPENLRFKLMAEMHPEHDPNVLKVKGRVLIEYAEKGYIPLFDHYFAVSRRLTFLPVDGYEFYKEWSYVMKHRKRKR